MDQDESKLLVELCAEMRHTKEAVIDLKKSLEVVPDLMLRIQALETASNNHHGRLIEIKEEHIKPMKEQLKDNTRKLWIYGGAVTLLGFLVTVGPAVYGALE